MPRNAVAGVDRYQQDAVLVGRAQSGDAGAFAELYSRHQGRVFHMALGMLRNLDEAEDVTQETFLNAYRGLERLADGQAFHAWTTRIAVNLCRRRAQRGQLEHALSLERENPETSLAVQVPDKRPRPEEIALRQELVREVRTAIAALPHEFREVICLHELDGLGLDEIAHALHVPLGTAKSRLSRGRRHLKRVLAAYVHEVDLPRRSQ